MKRAFTKKQIDEYLQQIPNWELLNEQPLKIQREFVFKDFIEAIEFVNKIGKIAEEQKHHPDINISYNNVTLTLYSHSIKGVSQNDFDLAAKINTIV